jgi:hypothetical protein
MMVASGERLNRNIHFTVGLTPFERFLVPVASTVICRDEGPQPVGRFHSDALAA